MEKYSNKINTKIDLLKKIASQFHKEDVEFFLKIIIELKTLENKILDSSLNNNEKKAFVKEASSLFKRIDKFTDAAQLELFKAKKS